MTTIYSGMRLTLDEFLALPEMDQRCEFEEGKLYIMPSPNVDHQQLSKFLLIHLTAQLEVPGLAHVHMPVDVLLSESVLVVPDIVVVKPERADIIGSQRINGAPDIAVEVLSSDANRDLVRKRRWYAEAGVLEYWPIDPIRNTLTALELAEGEYRERAVLTAEDTLTTPLFPEFSLPLAQLFNHPARIRS